MIDAGLQEKGRDAFGKRRLGRAHRRDQLGALIGRERERLGSCLKIKRAVVLRQRLAQRRQIRRRLRMERSRNDGAQENRQQHGILMCHGIKSSQESIAWVVLPPALKDLRGRTNRVRNAMDLSVPPMCFSRIDETDIRRCGKCGADRVVEWCIELIRDDQHASPWIQHIQGVW